jgi:protein ImuB
MSRYAAVYLPWVRVEIARACMARDEQRAPLAIVIARPGGVVKNECSLLGNTKLDEVSLEAHTCGVRAGMTIAAARAKSANLRVRVVALDAVTEVLACVAEAGLAFGATTSFDSAADVVCINVTGCAHLFGDEAGLVSKLDECVHALGHECRVAVADGVRVAVAVARHLSRDVVGPTATSLPRGRHSAVVVPPGENALAMSSIPLTALPLSDKARAWFSKLGMTCVGDLQKLPRSTLGMRLDAEAGAVMTLIHGEDTTPLSPYVPPEVPEERAELEYGIDNSEPLLFVAKMLCDRLSARLAGRAMAATRLELEMRLDRALAGEAALPPYATLTITLPAPLSKPAELLGVLRARVESYAIPAPILTVTLRATELVRKDARPLDLFIAEPKADRALPRLAAELAADLGDDRVGTLVLANTWLPEERTRLVPYRKAQTTLVKGPCATPTRGLLSRMLEPARLLATPIACSAVHGAKLLIRMEALEWWRRGLGSYDYVVAWRDEERALAWIEIDRATNEACVRGWMD